MWGPSLKTWEGELKLADTSRPLPLEYSLGFAARPFTPWLLTGDLKFPRDNDPTVALGTEGTWSPQEGWLLSARAGWSGEADRGLGDFSGTTVGFGVGFKSILVDYAFSPVNDLGDAHRISLAYSF
jgi:hypothetical protein